MFAQPENNAIVKFRVKRNFITHPLAASDPEGYTEYMPDLMHQIETLSINNYFQRNFSINFVPLVAPPFGSTPVVIAAHAALVKENETFDYEMPSQNAIALDILNQRLITYTLAQLPDGTFPPGTRPFNERNTANMTLFTAACTLEEKRREKEKDLIGPFLLMLKFTLTPELGSSVDTAQNQTVLVFQGVKNPHCERSSNILNLYVVAMQKPTIQF